MGRSSYWMKRLRRKATIPRTSCIRRGEFYLHRVPCAKGFPSQFWILNGLLLLCFLIMIKAKAGTVPGQKFADRQIFIPIIGIALQAVLVIVSLRHKWPHSPDPALYVYRAGNFGTQLHAQGTFGLISLFVANAMWQFVDVSSWQRISSIELSPSADQFAPIQDRKSVV